MLGETLTIIFLVALVWAMYPLADWQIRRR